MRASSLDTRKAALHAFYHDLQKEKLVSAVVGQEFYCYWSSGRWCTVGVGKSVTTQPARHTLQVSRQGHTCSTPGNKKQLMWAACGQAAANGACATNLTACNWRTCCFAGQLHDRRFPNDRRWRQQGLQQGRCVNHQALCVQLSGVRFVQGFVISRWLPRKTICAAHDTNARSNTLCVAACVRVRCSLLSCLTSPPPPTTTPKMTNTHLINLFTRVPGGPV